MRTPFRGVYMEQAPFQEIIRPGVYRLEEKPCFASGGDLLSYYQDTHVPLFLRKREFAAHLSDRMERRVVYCTQITAERVVATRGLVKIGTEDDEEFQELADIIRRQKELTGNETEAKVKKSSDFWDFMERWTHESFYTNEERYLFGAMSASDYYRERIARDSEAVLIRHKAWEEQQRLEYQLRKEKHRRMTEQYRQMLETTSESIERKIRVMETVQAIYCQGTLFALYLPRKEQEIWEIYGSGEIHPFHIAGTIYHMEKAGESIPYLPELLSHLAEAYGDVLPRLTKPKRKPEGISCEAWDLWMKIRMTVSTSE